MNANALEIIVKDKCHSIYVAANEIMDKLLQGDYDIEELRTQLENVIKEAHPQTAWLRNEIEKNKINLILYYHQFCNKEIDDRSFSDWYIEINKIIDNLYMKLHDRRVRNEKYD